MEAVHPLPPSSPATSNAGYRVSLQSIKSKRPSIKCLTARKSVFLFSSSLHPRLPLQRYRSSRRSPLTWRRRIREKGIPQLGLRGKQVSGELQGAGWCRGGGGGVTCLLAQTEETAVKYSIRGSWGGWKGAEKTKTAATSR